MQNTTSYISGTKSIPAELFQPSSGWAGGVVVIAYGSDGLIDNQHGPWATMIRQYASDLAGKGLTAMIPDFLINLWVSLSFFTPTMISGGSNDACDSQFTPAAPYSPPSTEVRMYNP